MRVDPPELIAALDRIKSFHPVVIDLSLDRIERLLTDLGSPHLKLPPVVHVAGTNGKGSVVALMRAVLEASGYKVHVYTSPHLVSFTERIRLSGDLIDSTLLIELIAYVESVNGDAPITFFEMITAIAYQAFAQIPADVLLLETGLGGRLDATNVVPNPAATVLTSIGMDHMSYLGNTLGAIAAEKAAIMKSGAPCISASQSPEAAQVISDTAQQRGVDVAWQGQDWTVEEDLFGTVQFNDGDTHWSMPSPALPGPHQIGNLGVALATLNRLPFAIPPFGLRAGMRQVEWPARLQRLKDGPVVARAPKGWDVWLDGGHNPPAGKVLSDWLAADPMSTVVICGMMATKDTRGFFAPWSSQVEALATIPIPGHENCASSQDLAEAADSAGIARIIQADDVMSALVHLQPHLTGQRGRILICGSLYLAGEILKVHS
ncbi:MAG: folylpolyglutamate synthase/dihydrofolate synthase family protein [Rhodospirillaceae bacterium]